MQHRLTEKGTSHDTDQRVTPNTHSETTLDEQGSPSSLSDDAISPRRRLAPKVGPCSPKYLIPAGRSGTARTIRKIEVCQIQGGKIPMRIPDKKDHRNLTESIKKYGQRFPIILHELEPNQRYEIIDGQRRLEAIKDLDLPTIDALIEVNLDTTQVLAARSDINQLRLGLSVIEKAKRVFNGRTLGLSDEIISETLSISTLHATDLGDLYETIGEEIVNEIGPAHGISFLKWVALKDEILRSGNEKNVIISLIDTSIADSKKRFKRLLSRLQAVDNM